LGDIEKMLDLSRWRDISTSISHAAVHRSALMSCRLHEPPARSSSATLIGVVFSWIANSAACAGNVVIFPVSPR
jgi:hypothetical protein